MAEQLVITRAGVGDLDDLVPLFGAYREFYKREAEPTAERAYLRDRLERGEAVVFIARTLPQGDSKAMPAGFALLYPTFASVGLRSAWILNDLFVAPSVRRGGVGRSLMEAACNFARASGAVRIELRTQHTNLAGQRLYESLGWKLDDQFRRYSLGL